MTPHRGGHALAALRDGTRGRILAATPASARSQRALEWLVEDRVPRGKLTLLAGQAGQVKSVALPGDALPLAGGVSPGRTAVKMALFGTRRQEAFVAPIVLEHPEEVDVP